MAEGNNSKEGEIPSSIPEIYFDIIARVVPGAIAIGAYKFAALAKTLNTPTVSFILLCSYFVGLLLHVIGDTIWWYAFYKWQPWLGGRLKVFRFDSIADLWAWIRNLPLADRAVFTKMMAERSMLQASALVAFVATFFPPKVVSANYSGPSWHITMLAFCAFFFGMVVVHRWVSWNKEILSARPVCPPASPNPESLPTEPVPPTPLRAPTPDDALE